MTENQLCPTGDELHSSVKLNIATLLNFQNDEVLCWKLVAVEDSWDWLDFDKANQNLTNYAVPAGALKEIEFASGVDGEILNGRRT